MKNLFSRERGCGKEGSSEQAVEVFGSEQYLSGVGVFHSHKGWARKILADAANEKQKGMQGQWQLESPFKEVLEEVKNKCGYSLWTS